MEDDKRKKKNKKKKNKQRAKAGDDNASNAGETSSGEQNHVLEQQNHTNRSVELNGVIRDHSSNKSIEDKESSSAATGKENWVQEEVRLREMVKQLLYEKNSYIERQNDLEMKIKQLLCESDSWHEKKISMEQRISKLLQEKASLSLEERNLQEKVNHFEKERAILVEKENTSKEMIATLGDENRRLQMQVAELEGAKVNLSQENRQLIDNISTLQSRIKDLEGTLAPAHSSTDAEQVVPENDDLSAQIEAACALVEKLVTENAELVEKLNELYTELGSRHVAAEVTSAGIPNYATVHHPVMESNEDMSSSAKGTKLFESVPIDNERVVGDMDLDYANMARHSSETAVSGEIVQIPLDENDAHDLEASASIIKEDEAVPLSDAPIVGAPFRLISFVARYVSGADLVQQDGLESP